MRQENVAMLLDTLDICERGYYAAGGEKIPLKLTRAQMKEAVSGVWAWRGREIAATRRVASVSAARPAGTVIRTDPDEEYEALEAATNLAMGDEPDGEKSG